METYTIAPFLYKEGSFVSKIPEIQSSSLDALWRRIRPVVRGPDGCLWFIDESQINLRETPFTRNPKLTSRAESLELLISVPIITTLLIYCKSPEPTVAEIFAQFIHPIHPEAPSLKSIIKSVHAMEVELEEFTINDTSNHMVIYVSLYR